MSEHSGNEGLILPGLDGANPIGFLAALGVLQLLSTACKQDKLTMAWTNKMGSWNPVLHGVRQETVIAAALADQLKCPFNPDKNADSKREQTQQKHDDKKAELKNAVEQLKRRGLRGNERKAAEQTELDPILKELKQLRSQWLAALRLCVPSLELSLGKHLNATSGELREHMLLALDEASKLERDILDLYAAFGSDANKLDKSDQMQATNFCFITGSGHQYFLDTIRQLVENVTPDKIAEAIFSQTDPQDEKFSMRWDPQEDRRHAVMWSDPTASGNKAKTNWALNLLGYRGLQLCSSVPTAGKLRTIGWRENPELCWRWPIWRGTLTANVIRSLFSNPILMSEKPSRFVLTELGVEALYQASRIQVGNPPLHKVNFTPAHQIA